MEVVRICEVYTSVQGEGPNTGKPITFVRFGGCNLRCPGWGSGELPDGTVVEGCDTVFAVYPQWKDTWDKIEPEGLRDLIPPSPKHICITGGEPLTQRRRDLEEFAVGLLNDDWKIDLFTNGSRPLPDWTQRKGVTTIMDWKMPGSGELNSFDINNLALLYEGDALKFVIKDRHDFETALRSLAWAEDVDLLNSQVWFGPVWDHMNPEVLAGWVVDEYPQGHLNIQTHKYIWEPEAREV